MIPASAKPHPTGHQPTFEEKNFLKASHETSISSQARFKPTVKSTANATAAATTTTTKKLPTLRRKSLASTSSKKSSLISTYDTLEQEIKQLQMRTQLDLPLMQQHHAQLLQERKQSIASINQIEFNDEATAGGGLLTGQAEPIVVKNNSLQSRLANIGRLDSKQSLTLNRSSTPDDNAKPSDKVDFEQFQLKLEK
jgi:hypothetical protein